MKMMIWFFSSLRIHVNLIDILGHDNWIDIWIQGLSYLGTVEVLRPFSYASGLWPLNICVRYIHEFYDSEQSKINDDDFQQMMYCKKIYLNWNSNKQYYLRLSQIRNTKLKLNKNNEQTFILSVSKKKESTSILTSQVHSRILVFPIMCASVSMRVCMWKWSKWSM